MRNLMLASAFALLIPASGMTASDLAPAPETPAIPAPADNRAAVADKIKSDWPRYDVSGKGHLTRPELAKWLTDLRVAAGQPAPDAEWQKRAFVQTDTNNDAKISLAELTAFLAAGA